MTDLYPFYTMCHVFGWHQIQWWEHYLSYLLIGHIYYKDHQLAIQLKKGSIQYNLCIIWYHVVNCISQSSFINREQLEYYRSGKEQVDNCIVHASEVFYFPAVASVWRSNIVYTQIVSDWVLIKHFELKFTVWPF